MVNKRLKIDYKPSECQSLKDLIFYYAFPNNAFKYRLKGDYAVDGVKGLIDKVNSNHDNFILVFSLMLNYGCMDIEDIPECISY